jgi:hypothetical protein
MNRKLYNIKSLIFIVIIIIFSIGYPIIYHLDIKPRKFKKELFEALKTENFFNASDTQLINFTECLTQKLLKRYKTIDNIPEWKVYGLEEKKMVLSCLIDNLITDSLNKQIYRNNFDSIINKIGK